MVEDRIEDGTRIAQLLASELTGLAAGPLSEVTVVDADPDVEPTPEGATAYGVAYLDRRIGTVTVYPEAAVLDVDAAALREAVETGPEPAGESDVRDGSERTESERDDTERDDAGHDRADGRDAGREDQDREDQDHEDAEHDDAGGPIGPIDAADVPIERDGSGIAIRVESGAAVKRAVDAFVEAIEDAGPAGQD